MPARHANPIIPGFAPDPSVTLVGDTFVLLNSSFHIFPGLPVYVSKDLVNWKHVGNAINRHSQLSLIGSTTTVRAWENDDLMFSTGGLYAPTVRFHRGTVYVICTLISHAGDNAEFNFIVTTQDIYSNLWSDPIPINFQGIDPSILFDDDGHVYVQGSRTPEFKIYQFEIDIKTGKQLSAQKEIWAGWDKRWTEGPHVYKKDGYYYLLAAEGGTFHHHMLSMARSKSVWGPYEAYEANPVITADGTDEYVQHVGHGDLFQDLDGRWWAVLLGVRKSKVGSYVLGRESFLTPVEWPEAGWPSLSPVRLDIDESRRLPAPTGEPCVAERHEELCYLRDAKLDKYRISTDGRQVTLAASAVEFSSPSESVTFVGKRQRSLEGQSVAKLLPLADPAQVRAGLALYKDEFRYASIYYDFYTSQICFQATNSAARIERENKQRVSLTKPVTLRLSYTELEYAFAYRLEDGDWVSLGSIETKSLTGIDFIGTIIGVYAIRAASETETEVSFELE